MVRRGGAMIEGSRIDDPCSAGLCTDMATLGGDFQQWCRHWVDHTDCAYCLRIFARPADQRNQLFGMAKGQTMIFILYGNRIFLPVSHLTYERAGGGADYN